jgi:glutamate racemase
MADRPIAFIDSGIGGLPYLEYTRALLPQKRFVYAADRENFPYGRKNPEEIVRATVSLTERLREREGPELVVVACNTMSVVALAELRRRFPLPFVGVVPAVKPAAAFSKSKCVAVLATQRTVNDRYLEELIEKHAEGCRVENFSAADLVDFVERDFYKAGAEEKRERVRREAERFRGAGADTVVLACTHFTHLLEDFRSELGDGVRVVDSREGVARQVIRLLGGTRERQRVSSRPDAFYLTGSDPIEARYAYFAERFGLELAGVL